MVPDSNYIAPVPLSVPLHPVPTIMSPPFIFGEKSQNSFLIAHDLILLYETI